MMQTLLRPACNGFCHGLHRHQSSPMVAVIYQHQWQQLQRQQLSTKTSSSPPSDDEPPVDMSATIIQGPSLLTSTGVHRPSPSLFHLPGLRSLPFWTSSPSSLSSSASGTSGPSPKHRIAFNDPFVSTAVSHLESNYHDIRSEYFAAVLGNSDQVSLDENDIKRRPLEPDYDVSSRGGEHANDALHTGSWDWHSCLLNGLRNEKFSVHCPKTASVVSDLEKEGMLFGTPFGFAFFSTLHGKSSIKAHTGPMNLRLRIHLPLVVPQDSASATVSQGRSRPIAGIRVADQVRQWTEGSALVLDDSYVHEAWNDADDSRVVFLCDIWHPDIRIEERHRIMNMFDYAKGKGWIGGNSQSSSS